MHRIQPPMPDSISGFLNVNPLFNVRLNITWEINDSWRHFRIFALSASLSKRTTIIELFVDESSSPLAGRRIVLGSTKYALVGPILSPNSKRFRDSIAAISSLSLS